MMLHKARSAPRQPSRACALRTVIAAIALAVPMMASAQFGGPGPGGGPGAPRGGGPGFGAAPGSQPRLEVVASFDADGDGILNAEERAAALEYVRSANAARPGRVGPVPGGRLPQGAPGGRLPQGPPGGVPSQAAVPPEPGIAVAPQDVVNHAGVALYDTGVLRTIFIDFALEGWEDEMAAFYGTDVEIPATVTIDGVTYRDVGVRFRGNSSFSMVSAGQKRPLRLKLDRVRADQNVEGFRTLNLHNGINDPTSIRTALYSTVAQDYLPTPRVALVQVVIEGELWGVYQHQQQFNSDFERDWFGRAGGVRWQVPGSPNGRGGMAYLGDDPEAYRGLYEIDNRDTPESWAALMEFFRVLDETPAEDLVEALEPILDLDGALRFLALDVALVNADGYWTRASDYYIYLDPDGRFHVFPHDINEGLGTAGFGRGGFPGGGTSASATLHPLVGIDDAAKALRSRLLAVPELRKRYLAYVLDVAERWLDWTTLAPVAQGMTDLIDDVVRAETRGLYPYEAFAVALDGPTASLRSFVDQRRAYLLATVPELIAAIAEDAYTPSATPAASVAPASVRAAADGWHVAAGTGSVAPVEGATGPTSAFVFEDLTANFGDTKLDQCVPIDDDAPFAIAFSVLALTLGEDASGLAVRVNPNFHADLEACLEAIALDAGGRRLGGGRANDDIDLALGATDGNRWSHVDQERLPALRYEADAIPAGTTFVRLSLRARDRSSLGTGPTVAFDDVALVQAGVDRVRDGGFEGPR